MCLDPMQKGIAWKMHACLRLLFYLSFLFTYIALQQACFSVSLKWKMRENEICEEMSQGHTPDFKRRGDRRRAKFKTQNNAWSKH